MALFRQSQTRQSQNPTIRSFAVPAYTEGTGFILRMKPFWYLLFCFAVLSSAQDQASLDRFVPKGAR